jgi:hypothetical protein
LAGTVTITALSSSEPGGERILGPISTQGTIVIGETLAVPLVTGDNTFAVPAYSTGVVIVQPTNGSVTLTVRTSSNSGDTGLPLSPVNPFFYTFPTAVPTSLILNSSAGQATPITLWFF